MKGSEKGLLVMGIVALASIGTTIAGMLSEPHSLTGVIFLVLSVVGLALSLFSIPVLLAMDLDEWQRGGGYNNAAHDSLYDDADEDHRRYLRRLDYEDMQRSRKGPSGDSL